MSDTELLPCPKDFKNAEKAFRLWLSNNVPSKHPAHVNTILYALTRAASSSNTADFTKETVCDQIEGKLVDGKIVWLANPASPSEWQREALDLIQETIGSTVGPQDQSGICLIHINQLERLSAFYARLEAVHDLMRRAPPPNNHNREGA